MKRLDNDRYKSAILRYWNKAPVDVVSIIRDMGLDYEEAELESSISGMIENVGGKYKISVNKNDSPARKRFTAAHELGHFLYHRDKIGNGVDDTKKYRSEPGGKYYNQLIERQHETEANQFAANLLMPSHLINRLNTNGIKGLEDQARALGVSIPAMRVRYGYEPYPEENEHT